MGDISKKISSYNLFNYLFPGVLFCLISDKLFSYNLIQKDIVIGVFLYYFVGLIISRIGSLLIEPFLKFVGFIKFANYSDYVKASKIDDQLELRSEVNNMYRTIIALFFSIVVISIYELILRNYPVISIYIKYVGIFTIFTIFLFAYKKQTKYICSRIMSNKD